MTGPGDSSRATPRITVAEERRRVRKRAGPQLRQSELDPGVDRFRVRLARQPSRFCLGCVEHVAEDVVVDHAQERELGSRVEPGGRHSRQRLLEMAHRIRSHLRRLQGGERPRVADDRSAGAPCDCGERISPSGGELTCRHQGFTHQGVVHQRNEVVLAAHVVIEAHRPGVELRRDPAHGHGFESLCICNPHGDFGDLIAREARPPRARFWASPDGCR